MEIENYIRKGVRYTRITLDGEGEIIVDERFNLRFVDISFAIYGQGESTLIKKE